MLNERVDSPGNAYCDPVHRVLTIIPAYRSTYILKLFRECPDQILNELIQKWLVINCTFQTTDHKKLFEMNRNKTIHSEKN